MFYSLQKFWGFTQISQMQQITQITQFATNPKIPAHSSSCILSFLNMFLCYVPVQITTRIPASSLQRFLQHCATSAQQRAHSKLSLLVAFLLCGLTAMAQMFPDFQGIPYEAGISLNTNNFIVGTTHIDRWKNPIPAAMTNIASDNK